MTKQNNHTIKQTTRYMQEQHIVASVRSGILPPAEELEKYEKLNPGTTKILLDTYQKQVSHRIELESKVIDSGIKSTTRGQIMAFILGLIIIFGGIALLFTGKDILGLSAIIGTLATLTGTFIYGNHSKRKERIEKSKAIPE